MKTTTRYFYITVKRILGFFRIYFLITDSFFLNIIKKKIKYLILLIMIDHVSEH